MFWNVDTYSDNFFHPTCLPYSRYFHYIALLVVYSYHNHIAIDAHRKLFAAYWAAFAARGLYVLWTEGDWVVLDWERGELNGIPAWDWFHFVLQPAILVEKLSVAALARRVDSLLNSAAFRRYAECAGILGVEHELLLGYLLHCRRILKPSIEVRQTEELLELLRQEWLSD